MNKNVHSHTQQMSAYIVVVRAEIFKVSEAGVTYTDRDGQAQNHQRKQRGVCHEACEERRKTSVHIAMHIKTRPN